MAKDGKPHPSYSTTKSGIAKYVSLLFHILSCEWSWRLLAVSSKGECPDETVQTHMPIILKGPRESKFNLASRHNKWTKSQSSDSLMIWMVHVYGVENIFSTFELMGIISIWGLTGLSSILVLDLTKLRGIRGAGLRPMFSTIAQVLESSSTLLLP